METSTKCLVQSKLEKDSYLMQICAWPKFIIPKPNHIEEVVPEDPLNCSEEDLSTKWCLTITEPGLIDGVLLIALIVLSYFSRSKTNVNSTNNWNLKTIKMIALYTCGNGYVDCDGDVFAHWFLTDQYHGDVHQHATRSTYCQGNQLQQSCNNVQHHWMVYAVVSTCVVDQITYCGQERKGDSLVVVSKHR